MRDDGDRELLIHKSCPSLHRLVLFYFRCARDEMGERQRFFQFRKVVVPIFFMAADINQNFLWLICMSD